MFLFVFTIFFCLLSQSSENILESENQTKLFANLPSVLDFVTQEDDSFNKQMIITLLKVIQRTKGKNFTTHPFFKTNKVICRENADKDACTWQNLLKLSQRKNMNKVDSELRNLIFLHKQQLYCSSCKEFEEGNEKIVFIYASTIQSSSSSCCTNTSLLFTNNTKTSCPIVYINVTDNSIIQELHKNADNFLESRLGGDSNTTILSSQFEEMRCDDKKQYLSAVLLLNETFLLIFIKKEEIEVSLAKPRYLLKLIDNYSGDRFLIFLFRNALGQLLVDQFTLYDESIPENFSHGKVHGNVKPIKTQKEMMTLINEGYDSKNCLKIMTYNVYNFESGAHWDQRQKMIGQMIKIYQPDVIGFQEIRISYVSDHNMLEDLASNIPDYDFVYARSNYYWSLGMEEGLCIFSKIPILNFTVHKLPILDDDNNQRIILQASLQTPWGIMEFLNTHWSYGRFSQKIHAMETWRITRKFENAILAGDLNIYSEDEEAANFLSGEAISLDIYDDNSEFFRSETVKIPKSNFNISGDLIDVWNLLQPGESGETFKSSPLHRINRADRILYRGSKFVPNKIFLLGEHSRYGLFPSDHLAVLATFCKANTTSNTTENFKQSSEIPTSLTSSTFSESLSETESLQNKPKYESAMSTSSIDLTSVGLITFVCVAVLAFVHFRRKRWRTVNKNTSDA